MVKSQNFWQRLASGFLIGFGMVIPGVSGAVLAMLLGFYEPIIAAIAKPFDDLRGNLRLLVPLVLGFMICILFLARVLEFLFAQHPLPTLYFFLGLVAASLPTMIKVSNVQGFRLSYIVSCLFGLLLIILSANLSGQLAQGEILRSGFSSSIISGIILGASLLIPGLSTSFLLIAFGLYEGLLKAVVHFDFSTLLYIGLGFIPTIMLASKIINWLFNWKYGHVSYAIMGLMLGSLWLAFPGWPHTVYELLLCAALFSVGVGLASLFVRKQAV